MMIELSFPSFNERDQVQAWIYTPTCEPHGIIQLIHGFGEHSRRYMHMIMHFLDAGYIVAADDHVGHGATAIANNGTWGNWGSRGFETMVNDEYTLYQVVVEKYPDLPYMLFGHSMGSVIARQFAARHGDEIEAVALCGTPGDFPTREAEKILEKDIAAGQGDASDPHAAEVLMGWMNERCGDVKIGNEWICTDEEVQLDDAQDPFNCLKRPTANSALLYFCQMIDDVKGTAWAEKVPQMLPFLSLAGDQDPFGSYGVGPYQMADWLTRTGHLIITQMFSGERHEVHNAPDTREDVENLITTFFDNTLQLLYGEADDEDEEEAD